MKTMAPKTKSKTKPKPTGRVKSCGNPIKSKHPGGRPPKYKTPQELQEKIDAYFNSCWIDKVTEVTDKDGKCTMSTVRYQNRPYTVAGLALALGLCRDTLAEYVKAGQFSDVVKKAKIKIEMNVEELFLEGKNAEIKDYESRLAVSEGKYKALAQKYSALQKEKENVKPPETNAELRDRFNALSFPPVPAK